MTEWGHTHFQEKGRKSHCPHYFTVSKCIQRMTTIQWTNVSSLIEIGQPKWDCHLTHSDDLKIPFFDNSPSYWPDKASAFWRGVIYICKRVLDKKMYYSKSTSRIWKALKEAQPNILMKNLHDLGWGPKDSKSQLTFHFSFDIHYDPRIVFKVEKHAILSPIRLPLPYHNRRMHCRKEEDYQNPATWHNSHRYTVDFHHSVKQSVWDYYCGENYKSF